ncbi:MAG: hypothetical protein DCC52_13780 [Chloroflexi bacterium]|nr:MAG: hypothetical protein DCC52_13780 [Chloroflexota bacterium]
MYNWAHAQASQNIFCRILMRILSHRDVEQAVTMPQAIEVMQDAFARLANHQATVPLRSQLPVPQYNGVALFMPAYIQGTDALAIKIVNVFGDNAQRGLPLIHAVVVVLEAQTGRALALIEGGALTALRTGAGCGAATIALARSDARVGLVFGAGVQARTQLRALCAARQLERVYVYDPAPAKAQAMLAELCARPELPADLRVADDVASAVRAADIISCATTSKQPLFDGNDVQPGAHVNAIGSFTPEARETDDRGGRFDSTNGTGHSGRIGFVRRIGRNHIRQKNGTRQRGRNYLF